MALRYMEMTDVFTVREGKVVGIEVFWDHAEALAAVGLPHGDSLTGE